MFAHWNNMLQNNKNEVVSVTLKESENLKVDAGLRDIPNKAY